MCVIGQTTEDTCVLNTRDFFFSLPDVLACVRMNECAGFHVVLRAYDSTQVLRAICGVEMVL